MRKISKNRADEDVVSSTNGSVVNEDPPAEPEAATDLNEKDADSDANDSVERSDGDKDRPKARKDSTKKTKKGKGKKKKHQKDATEESTDEEYQGPTAASDINDKDADSDANDSIEQTDGDKAKRKTRKESTKKTKKGKGGKKKQQKEATEESADEEYEVDKVIASKKMKGKLHYLIRWKGYSADSDTWEPEDTLSCPDLINKFNAEKENSKNKEAPSGKNRKRKSAKESKVPSKKPKNEWDSQSADENAEYEVERILEVHHKKNGKREFLIHWKGWSNKFDSWEPESHLNCSDLIKKFMDKVDVARSSDTRDLRVAPETTNRFTLQSPSSGRRLSRRRGQRQRVRYDNAE